MASKRPAKPRTKATEAPPNEESAKPPPRVPATEVSQAQPSFVAPPKKRFAPTLTAALLLLAAAVALFGVLRHRGGDQKFELKLGVPTAASVSDLRSFASAGRPVYWVGPPKAGRMEVTRTSSGAVYVRYLPPGVDLGDSTPNYTTIATYPTPDAYASLTRSGRAAGAVRAEGPRHALVVWRQSRRTSLYLAYRGTDYLIEVYDPSPRRARALALSRKIQPVS